MKTEDSQKISAEIPGAFLGYEVERSVTLAGYILFHEYFHADTGEGLGASHQTGWTGLAAELLLMRPDNDNA